MSISKDELVKRKEQIKKDQDRLKFKEKDAIGSGFFGEVFRVTDGKTYDPKFVAKVFYTPKALAVINRIGYGVSFERETRALKFLGPKNVSPKLYFEKDGLKCMIRVRCFLEQHGSLVEMVELDRYKCNQREIEIAERAMIRYIKRKLNQDYNPVQSSEKRGSYNEQ